MEECIGEPLSHQKQDLRITGNKEESENEDPIQLQDFVTVKRPYSNDMFTLGDSSNEDFQENCDWLERDKIDKQDGCDSFLGLKTSENRGLDFHPGKAQNINQVFSLEMEHMKRYALARYIQEDPKAADFKWSLFCAACQSYRFDSMLKPFPPVFFTENSLKDIDKLREISEMCPTMSILHDQLQDRSKDIQPLLIDLLYWVLIHLGEPQLKYVPKAEHSKILSLVSSSGIQSSLPNHIVQVVHNDKHPWELKFRELAEQYTTKFAYHGSRLDNFYSILNHGLQISLNKVAAFGPGIYLSSEMNISLSYSPAGFGWGGSYFGSQLSVVALCEMVDHPDVKFQKGSKENFCKMIAEGSENGPVPKRYFIVQNSDLIRVRYLLIFANEGHQQNMAKSGSLLGWIKEHKMITIIIGYVLLLLAVGTSNSAVMYRYYRRFLRRLGFQILNI